MTAFSIQQPKSNILFHVVFPREQVGECVITGHPELPSINWKVQSQLNRSSSFIARHFLFFLGWSWSWS